MGRAIRGRRLHSSFLAGVIVAVEAAPYRIATASVFLQMDYAVFEIANDENSFLHYPSSEYRTVVGENFVCFVHSFENIRGGGINDYVQSKLLYERSPRAPERISPIRKTRDRL